MALESRRNVSVASGGREQNNARLKSFCDKSGDRNAGGRQFQMVGPLNFQRICRHAIAI